MFRSRALQGVENLPCTSGGFRGGVRWGDRTPLRENFFDFSQQKRTKNKFILLRTHLKMCFCLWSHPPSKILDPPLPCTALPGQGRAGYATSKARQGKVTKIFKVQVAGYQNTLTCRALNMILIPTRVMVCALSEEKIKVHSNPQALSLIYESEFKSILLTDTVYNINSRSEIYMTEVFLLAKSLIENKYRSMLYDFFSFWNCSDNPT